MSARMNGMDDSVESLRCQVEAEARFRRVAHGYDTEEVRKYIEDMKRVISLQTKAAKKEQEALIEELDSTKNEIQARNCAIKTLKASLAEQDVQLSTANVRIATLIQSVKRYDAERVDIERFRAAEAAARINEERANALEAEAQKLRQTLRQAAGLIESWKTEREQLKDENARLRMEAEYLRNFLQCAMPQREAEQEPAHEATHQRGNAPRMQVIRPDGSVAEHTGIAK